MTELFYFNSSAYDELNSELDSNRKVLQAEQFQKLDVTKIFEQLYLMKLHNVVKKTAKEKRKSEEYKSVQIVDLPPIPHNLFLLMLNHKANSCIFIEIVNQLFTSNIVSLVEMSNQDALDDQKSCFVSFCAHDQSEIKDNFKTFSQRTNISSEALNISYKISKYLWNLVIW